MEEKEIYFNKVHANIKNNGYHTTAVLEEENFTPFAYSTGIFENFEIPELFISGLGPNLSGEIIKNYTQKYKLKEVPLDKKIEDLIEQFPFSLLRLKMKTYPSMFFLRLNFMKIVSMNIYSLFFQI